MATDDLVERLTAHATLGSAPREELEWLAAHGTLRTLAPGDVMSARGQNVENLYILLSGAVGMFVDRGTGPNKVMEWSGGQVTGVLPYSRMTTPPGNMLAISPGPTEVLAIPRACLQELTRACYQVTAILVHAMVDRARTFNANDMHDEKMASLGKLSAGLAHELNNPAAAIERGAALLEDRLEDAERAARELGAARLSDEQFAAIDAVRASCLAASVSGVRSPIEQAEREESIADWLADHGLDTGTSEALADTAVTFGALEHIARAVPETAALNAVLRWAAFGCAVRGLALEIQDSAVRISGLVTAIKGFTHMDQGTAAEPVDLGQALSNTIAVLRSKARSKSVAVAVDVDPTLPRVRGFVGELNQIWANLIDNALDAVSEGGRISVRATYEHPQVVVRILDNGSGIPPEIRDRIFDPFFTTKPVGLGTGLGLDIVRRLVRHNNGDIFVESEPGRTEFRVVLPLAETPTGGQA